MGLFSKKSTSQPVPEASTQSDATAQEPAEPPFAMTLAQYEALISKLDGIYRAVDIVDDNVRLLIRKLDTLQGDMTASIRNDHVAENYFLEAEKATKQIRNAINALSK